MLEDVQSQTDKRGIKLDQVGVTGLHYPIVLLDRERERQETIASITMSVSLPHNFKGAHMSRFLEVLNDHQSEVTMRTMPKILRHMREILAAESARIELSFPFFLKKSAPKSHAKGLMDYECKFVGEMKGKELDFMIGVKVPVTSLCPCSKEISDYGAHSQRGVISIEAWSSTDETGHPHLIWIEELISIAESSASCQVYPLLKRADEKFVTMHAYDNPVFVEDIVRNVALKLKASDRMRCFRVHVENYESIHNHSAFAEVFYTFK